ncbi:uracil-DNA glycosylase family protein [Sphingomicrobium sp. XHP0239]|uniref:uracil-DNA glycosylase family protein n=1 Tax=Sphingomicrobium maritimum TaxID=3133972 RepID=UPI0031CCBCEA
MQCQRIDRAVNIANRAGRMGEGTRIDPREAAALLDWWRQAGVDAAVQSPAPTWRSLGKSPVPVAVEAPAAAPVPASDTRPEPPARNASPSPDLPDDAKSIASWLKTRSERLGAQHVGAALSPDTGLAVIAARPVEAETGIGAAHAPLLAAMLRAIGQEGAPVVFLDPAFREGQSEREPVEPDLVDAMKRLIATHRPGRLLFFGDGAARAMLGEPLAKARGKSHRIEGVPAVATFHPRWLMDRPQDKRLAWEDLQILMENE